MASSRVKDYLDRFAESLIRFNPYTIKKMGLLPSQTMLQLDEYMLICAPYQLSISRVVVLVILSKDEIIFFQRFHNKTASLTIAFQKTGTKGPENFHIRGILSRMGPVKGKNNVCMMDINYKSCPEDLVEMIGDHILSSQSLKGQYENFKNRVVEIDEERARTLRFNNYVETVVGGQKAITPLLSLAVNQIVLSFPSALPAPQTGQKIQPKLYFQTYQFIVNATVADIQDQGGSGKRVTLDIDYSPELVEIMDDFFFRTSFKKS